MQYHYPRNSYGAVPPLPNRSSSAFHSSTGVGIHAAGSAASGPGRTPHTPPSPQECSTLALCRAARRFADGVAADAASYVCAYLAALNSAVELHDSRHHEAGRPPTMRRRLPSPVLIADPCYATNALHLYSSAQATAIPQPVPNKRSFAGCVAIRAGERSFTGILLGRNLVFTSARIAPHGDELQVILGSNTAAPTAEVPVRRVIVHPDYNPETGQDDAVLLVLDTMLSRGLADPAAGTDVIDAATWLRVVGFGHAEQGASVEAGVKRYVDVPVATAHYGEVEDLRYGCRSGIEFVTGKPALDRDGCAVDIGAPFYVRAGSGWRVAGIVSRPLPGLRTPCGDGLVGLRIDRYLSWIHSVPEGRW